MCEKLGLWVSHTDLQAPTPLWEPWIRSDQLICPSPPPLLSRAENPFVA